jgi:uncharacterized protein YceK
MPWENPGAYDEARKRIRENKESETVIREKKKEDFEKSKDKVHSKKKLDVYELRRRIETGTSLNTLKSDIQEALNNGQISMDNYTNAIEMLSERNDEKWRVSSPEYIISDDAFPFSKAPLTTYFEDQKLWDNFLVDIAGFTYGVAQGSIFLLYMTWRIVLDTLLLPVDIYRLIQK